MSLKCFGSRILLIIIIYNMITCDANLDECKKQCIKNHINCEEEHFNQLKKTHKLKHQIKSGIKSLDSVSKTHTTLKTNPYGFPQYEDIKHLVSTPSSNYFLLDGYEEINKRKKRSIRWRTKAQRNAGKTKFYREGQKDEKTPWEVIAFCAFKCWTSVDNSDDAALTNCWCECLQESATDHPSVEKLCEKVQQMRQIIQKKLQEQPEGKEAINGTISQSEGEFTTLREGGESTTSGEEGESTTPREGSESIFPEAEGEGEPTVPQIEDEGGSTTPEAEGEGESTMPDGEHEGGSATPAAEAEGERQLKVPEAEGEGESEVQLNSDGEASSAHLF